MAKKKFWSSDKIVATTAIFISLLTLFIFIRQTNIIEKQSHSSVMPYLMIETSNNSANSTYSIDLVNYGLGPAFIEDAAIIYKGNTYENIKFTDFLKQNISEMDSIDVVNYTTMHVGQAIPAGNKINIATIGGRKNSYNAFLKVMKQLLDDKFDYQIEYKSIYDHRWKINASNVTPEEL